MTAGVPRKTETRQALIDAVDVFLRRGFARATTREIAQTAGVAEGTISTRILRPPWTRPRRQRRRR